MYSFFHLHGDGFLVKGSIESAVDPEMHQL
jgi:hypothetical protein